MEGRAGGSWPSAGAVFLLTGSAAHADPRPDAVELRLLVDDCPAPTSATAP
ncbi:hypothetical protein [Streptosporangium longisporum]|uniref:hypothetical protein n=1 Tax=Streptosporangium longisporum TaxID=46187 RepID=UPI0031E9B3CB